MTLDSFYSIGDWIVHKAYGIGQIKKIEKRSICGQKVRAFRVKTKDSIFWVSLHSDDNPRIRRAVNKRKIRRELRTVKSKPEKMDKNDKTRNNRIVKVFEDNSIQKKAMLLRDLLALGNNKK